MIRITDILDKTGEYLSREDLEMIEKAYIFSATVHKDQKRLSGEPYLIHPLEVAGILVEMKLDKSAIITGLLHDAVEDTLTTIKEIKEDFGDEVAFLVEGLTKISKISFGSQIERQAENFRKMMLAMSSDIRILIVKLADRVHNMRTLEYQPEDRQRFIARETLEVYAPLASRLGINWMKMELEDLSFKHLSPEKYFNLLNKIAKKKEEREEYTEKVKRIIQEKIEGYGLKGRVDGRPKHLYSIYEKMNEQHINFDEVYDLMAFRIILDSNEVKECYEALSVIHASWKPVPGRFKDYIAMPKANNYRSLHTTVIGPYGERVEVQMRTREMHEWAEKGIAAHWRYKEGRVSSDEDEGQIEKLRELFEVQQEHKDAREFMRNLKISLFPDEVYIFTPHGDVKSFPKGATPVDFAYSVHTDVGNHCIGAKINRNIVSLKYKLQNGDTVEILTQPGHHPSKDWLKYAVTSRARSKIKQWIKTEERGKSIAIGRDVLEREFKKNHLTFKKIVKSNEFKEILSEQSLGTVDDLMALIGYGKISAKYIINHFINEGEKKEEDISEKPKKKPVVTSDTGITITGVEDVMVRFAKCCSPLPGDDIIGYITRGRGISVHVSDCPVVQEMDTERLIEVHWDIKQKQTFRANIRLVCIDKKGLLSELSSVISSLGININSANIDTIRGDNATCEFELDINDLDQFNTLSSAFRKMTGVLSVERVRGAFSDSMKKGYIRNSFNS
jgi:GTP pyrophosphokinase